MMMDTRPEFSARHQHGPGGVISVVVGAVAAFAVFLDTTIVNLALPTLSQEFGAHRSSIEWVIDAYTLSFAAMMLGAGLMSDRFGARRVFTSGIVTFVVASIGCALATNMLMLNAMRLIQGVGGALLLPSSLSLATQDVKGIYARRLIVATWSASGGVGMAAGPLLGGLVVTGFGWRWLFWINVVVGVVTLIMTPRLTPSPRRRDLRSDIIGQVVATTIIASLIFIPVEGPRLGWTSPLELVAVGVGLIGLITLLIVERRTAHPLIPPRLAIQAEFVGSALLGALFNLAFYGVLFALSLLLQDVKGQSALRAGINFLPLTGLIFLGNLTAPRIARHTSTNRVLYLGQAFLVVGLCATIFTAPMA